MTEQSNEQQIKNQEKRTAFGMDVVEFLKLCFPKLTAKTQYTDEMDMIELNNGQESVMIKVTDKRYTLLNTRDTGTVSDWGYNDLVELIIPILK